MLMSLATEHLFISVLSPPNWPLENNVRHQAHHHRGQDGAVDGDEVFVEAVAEEARRAGTRRGRLSAGQRAVRAIGGEVIGEWRQRRSHVGGGNYICG